MTMAVFLIFLWMCPPEPAPKLSAPIIDPKGINPSAKPVAVQFQVEYQGQGERPASLTLELVDKQGNLIKQIGLLRDDGKNSDHTQGDRRYSGVFPIVARQLGELRFRGTARVGGRLVVSEAGSLIVTKFPVGLAPSNPKAILQEANTEQKLYANEILVGFVAGTSAEEIERLLAAQQMKVIGTDLDLGVYQIRIPGESTAAGVHAAVKALQMRKEVEFAEPHWIGEFTLPAN